MSEKPTVQVRDFAERLVTGMYSMIQQRDWQADTFSPDAGVMQYRRERSLVAYVARVTQEFLEQREEPPDAH